MKKRIYQSMLLLALVTIFCTSLLITGVIYREFYRRMQQEIRNEALLLAASYNQNGPLDFSKLAMEDTTSRITWVAEDGTVLFDNRAEPAGMENHGNRPEIMAALRDGAGEAVHLSKTLGTQTFYRAVRLTDGTVLRVSASIHSVFKAVFGLLPYIALMLLPVFALTMLLANLLTGKIIVPLNNLNLDEPLANEVYDELSPLLTRMARQKEEIARQFQKLREKQEEFNAITENIREGIIILNSKGQILSLNKSAAAIFGVGAGENLNRHFSTLNRSIPLQKAVAAALGGQPYEDTLTKGENTFDLLASPVLAGQQVRGVILFILDITEKHNAEKMRREFTANVSHELKTPLTSILGYAELMKNGMVKPEDMAAAAGRIYAEARHLLRLVEDTIKLSRLDEQNLQLPWEKIDLLALAQEVAGRLAPLAQEKQISLSVSGERAVVSGVRPILEDIVYNLCDNAIKYNWEKGRVEVKVAAAAGEVRLTVQDNGFGIPREHQGRIFERFYRIDRSHSRATGGTGLGLSIVKHGAELHQARLELDSEPGKGTAVTVVFRSE
ncbi:sensor histidine kinase [Capillibacterium thermochitinicola]|uniref:histidine kinase n=1 Tax=Capillibacterium thermochitinicola TaxID=2699427 RepID=A0A8J6I371_9FIRM|nr:ATP-binding protein [Capillibacterium thermochitinicola]MBA2134123.1 PAS domain S-box protein [Capillibacterium thermochitinicola]